MQEVPGEFIKHRHTPNQGLSSSLPAESGRVVASTTGMKRTAYSSALIVLLGSATACATFAGRVGSAEQPDFRRAVIARAQLWTPTDVRAMDIKAGPGGKGAFPFRATVYCDYLDKKLSGDSPKFVCLIGKDDEVKVKFGGGNGEVFGEVLATRLLWALGFPADRMYPVNVICRRCPIDFGGIERPNRESRFDPAVIERKAEGKEWPSDDTSGWSWDELDSVDAESGGAPKAQRDALKLLAVFIQHTDSKPQQQRILCLEKGPESKVSCNRPFMMLNDVGVTFGRANRTNSNEIGSVNLAAWRRTPVWKDDTGCTGNLPRSMTGTLDNPSIGEAGRRFLADLLVQLSDRQIRDLFEVARVGLRLRSPGDASSGLGSVDEWMDAFKEKRSEIVTRKCEGV